MNIKSFLKTVGLGLISAHPLGAAAIGLINKALPDDKKLPENATGQDAEAAIVGLSPAQQEVIYLADVRYDIKVLETDAEKYAAMCAADSQETRAKIVIIAMWALIVLSVMFVAATAWVYIEKGAQDAFSPAMIGVYLSVTATFAYVVRAYFGDLKSETKSRHEMIDGKPRKPGLVETLLNRK